jgi:hypothetical protein
MKKNKIHPIDLSYNFTDKIREAHGLTENNVRNSFDRAVFDRELIRYQQDYIHVLENIIDNKKDVNIGDLRENVMNPEKLIL